MFTPDHEWDKVLKLMVERHEMVAGSVVAPAPLLRCNHRCNPPLRANRFPQTGYFSGLNISCQNWLGFGCAEIGWSKHRCSMA